MDVYLALIETEHLRYFRISRMPPERGYRALFGPTTITEDAYWTIPQIHIAREIAAQAGFDIDDEQHWPLPALAE